MTFSIQEIFSRLQRFWIRKRGFNWAYIGGVAWRCVALKLEAFSVPRASRAGTHYRDLAPRKRFASQLGSLVLYPIHVHILLERSNPWVLVLYLVANLFLLPYLLTKS